MPARARDDALSLERDHVLIRRADIDPQVREIDNVFLGKNLEDLTCDR